MKTLFTDSVEEKPKGAGSEATCKAWPLSSSGPFARDGDTGSRDVESVRSPIVDIPYRISLDFIRRNQVASMYGLTICVPPGNNFVERVSHVVVSLATRMRTVFRRFESSVGPSELPPCPFLHWVSFLVVDRSRCLTGGSWQK